MKVVDRAPRVSTVSTVRLTSGPLAEEAGRSPGATDGASVPLTVLGDGRPPCVSIRCDHLLRSPFWPRLEAAPSHVLRLADSLKQEGRIATPLLVRQAEGGSFEVMLGHLRLEAALLLRWQTVPAVILDCSDAEAVRTIAAEHHTYPLKAYERLRLVRHLVETGPSVGLEDIKGLLKLRSKGDASTIRSAARLVTPDVLELAGIDESRDARALRSKIMREDLRDLVSLKSDAEVAAFLRAKLEAGAEDVHPLRRAIDPIREIRSIRGRRRWEFDERTATAKDVQAWAAARIREIDARDQARQGSNVSL